MKHIGIPELTSEQTEQLCIIAEEAARKYVHLQISKKNIEALNISVELEGTKPVTLTVDVDIDLPPSMRNLAQKLADKAIKEAFNSAEKYLRELACLSQK